MKKIKFVTQKEEEIITVVTVCENLKCNNSLRKLRKIQI